jgi:DNA-binding NarL/FixJ family response regulator
MDLDLPGMDGAEATARLRALCPDARVVAVSGVQDRGLIARAVQAGISGFVPKTGPAEELVGLIRAVAEDPGDLAILLPPEGVLSLLRASGVDEPPAAPGQRAPRPAEQGLERLTPRERQVLEALAGGSPRPRWPSACSSAPGP